MKDDGNQLIVICSTDHNFVSYTGIMLTSLFEHNPDAVVYVLVDQHFSDKDKRNLLRLRKKNKCQLSFICVDANVLRDFPVLDGITASTYYKIFSTELLSPELSKVLYLDSDILIRGSLQGLWETDLTGFAMAGVRDLYDNSNETYERLKYPREYGYLNAGMLLLNLDWWRKHDVYHKCLNYIQEYHDRILWCEQDVLNVVLAENKLPVSMHYNYQIPMLAKWHYEIISTDQQKELREEKDPAVVHYIGREKPWNAEYYGSPYWKEWIQCKRHSLWRYMPLVLSSKLKVRTLIKRYFLWPLGWRINNQYLHF